MRPRMSDLTKEYSAELPGLAELVWAFAGMNPSHTIAAAAEIISAVIHQDKYSSAVQQQFALFSSPVEALRALYSVGFIGVKESSAHNFVFCHDGRKPDKEFGATEQLIVHPCYWIALNLTNRDIAETSASEIYDEYDITVRSETPEQRARAIGKMESELREIEIGLDGAVAFEKWCLKVIRVLFPGGLRNIELHDNKTNLQRRDVLGTNHGTTDFWNRILVEYGSRQIVFEVKNIIDLSREHFWQMNSYLCQDYGRFGFIITRGDEVALRKDRELSWVRELKSQHSKVVMIITAKFLLGLLNKIRSPIRHDYADDAMDKLLDVYVRSYFGESVTTRKKKKKA